MSTVRVLGIGSPSGDDQAGWLTVDALLSKCVLSGHELVIEKLDRPGASLIPKMENASWVILVDAMQSTGQVGQVQRFDQTDWAGYCQGLSSHGFGVLAALSLAHELGCLPHRLDVYGIGIGQVTPGEAPSESIQVAAKQLAMRIATDLNNKQFA
ncbi:MAG: hydrogenase maturation protease [Sulfuriferula multivorans]|uniref:Hydrogenase maturation protease n=1 Tax=Sulfuriferula multivorans TaxID=1559896 RepID=A0A7C9JVK3_9PROT|nr:hydrogenase maturation protease [Sulfuriferula multivorans]